VSDLVEIPPFGLGSDLYKGVGCPRRLEKVMTSPILGHPKYRYKKSLHRDLAGVTMM